MKSTKAKPSWYLEKPEEARRLQAACSLPQHSHSQEAGANGGAGLPWAAPPRSAGAASGLSGFDSGVGKVRIAIKHTFFLKHKCDFMIKTTQLGLTSSVYSPWKLKKKDEENNPSHCLPSYGRFHYLCCWLVWVHTAYCQGQEAISLEPNPLEWRNAKQTPPHIHQYTCNFKGSSLPNPWHLSVRQSQVFSSKNVNVS